MGTRGKAKKWGIEIKKGEEKVRQELFGAISKEEAQLKPKEAIWEARPKSRILQFSNLASLFQHLTPYPSNSIMVLNTQKQRRMVGTKGQGVGELGRCC